MGLEHPAEDPHDLPRPLTLLRETFPNDIQQASLSHGEAVAIVSAGGLREIMEFLKNDARMLFDMLVDITAVDYLGREPRFEVIYHLLSLPLNHRVRIKLPVSGDSPSVESLTDLWGSANWLEREVWDMFGIKFSGHPNMKRILLYPEFQGHPLRKDYPIRRRQPLIGPKN